MVPLTEVSVEHSIEGVAQRRHLSAALVNRDRIESVVVVIDEEVEMPDLPFDRDKAPLVKDFTGAVRPEGEAGLTAEGPR